MCGHVGTAGFLEKKDEALMERLFLLDFFRGPDSTGLAAIRINGDPVIAKLASDPITTFQFPKFKAALNGMTSKVFIGHNRLATKGAVSNFNAHPYQFGHITGAHNGTLDYESWGRLDDLLGVKYPVDSMALIAAISEFGIEETMKEVRGAWSLVWYDQERNSLNFLRNKERPMWYAFSKDFRKIIWASEWEMINGATTIMKYDLHTELHEGKEVQFFGTNEDVHYEFSLPDLTKGGDTKPKAKARPVKGKEPPPVVSSPPFVAGSAGGGTHRTAPLITQGMGSGTNTTTTTSHGAEHRRTDVFHLFGHDGDPFAGIIDEGTFLDIAQNGCQWCLDAVDYTEPGCMVFEKEGVIICPTCAEELGKDPVTRFYPKNFQALLAE